MADDSNNYPKETPKVLHSQDGMEPPSRKRRKKRKGGKGPGENPWWPWF
jgi:hypothetical protein